MNWTVLKDSKSILGFILSLVFAVVAVIMAVNQNSYWVAFVFFALIISFFSVKRADKIYKQGTI